MTKNQIDYLNYLETRRNNMERATNERVRDENTRVFQQGSLSETNRHNLATEQLQFVTLGETQRHNQAVEAYNRDSLLEVGRHNQAQEYISLRGQVESERSHRASEALTRDTLSETARSNRAREAEASRSNRAQEELTSRQIAESVRTHKANEAIGRSQVQLGYSQLSEQKRHSMQTESEVHRANVRNEQLTEARNIMTFNEAVRSSVAREQETYRHNLETEAAKAEEIYNTSRSLDLREQELQLESQRVHNEGIKTWSQVAESGVKASRYIIPLLGGMG